MTAKINRVKEKQFSELKKLSEEKVCAPQVIEAINKRMASITNNEANKPYLSKKVKGFFVKMKNVCKDHSKYPGNKHGKEISTYSSKLNFIDQFLIQIEDH